MPRRTARALLFLGLVFCTAAAPETAFTYTPAVEAALAHISADSMRGNLSFLASDLLEGRATPSRGLDIAAEFIAGQFRKAGLEPAGDDGYFQTANFVVMKPRNETFSLTLDAGAGSTTVGGDGVISFTTGAIDIQRAPVLLISGDDSAPVPGAAEVSGKVVVLDRKSDRIPFRLVRSLRALKPALVLSVSRNASVNLGPERLVDPEEQSATAPWIVIRSEALAKALEGGAAGATATVHLDAPATTPVKLRNVIGVLRGSDPALKDTCVLVTAHYDHIGLKPDCHEGDCIFNGANDDGSGTVSVVELAGTLAALRERPRRSIVFMTFFGEEEGGFGARYYTRHPVFPLAKTVADVNLEQLGRTDGDGGTQVNNATFTGFGFSDLPLTFRRAGEMLGIKVYKSSESDSYFSRSDNQTLANAGVPAHTMCVAYYYPDYHGLADTWDKIDYENMARVDRMVGLGVLMLASDAEPPRWNESSQTESYVKAWREHHPAPPAPAGR